MTSIDYQLSFERYNEHLVDVAINFETKNKAPIVWLPSWLAGSYLMREFARNITAVYYQVDGETHKADKLSKNEWQLTQAKKGDKLTINYEVYCYDLSVRAAYVDNMRIFGNFSSLALAIDGQADTQISLALSVPLAFYANKKDVKIAFGLQVAEVNTETAHIYHAKALNYDALIDYPFEIAEQTHFCFTTTDNNGKQIPHRFYISGQHSTDVTRLKTDIQKICQTYNNWLGDTPFADYTFLTFASGNDYGGLEHINSTALITPRDDLPSFDEPAQPSDAYQRFLGLCSHEYFHAWWVKTVRPDVMMGVDLRQEAYTPLLWVFEGFTSYIDDFMLQASGVVSKASYLKLLTTQINRYNQTAGRYLQSVAESSFDAWIKLYRGDENTGNAGISYYNKGALVALCLDLLMINKTDGKKRLFDVVKAFYALAKQADNHRFGMNDTNLANVMISFIGEAAWQAFYDNYIIGLKPLPIAELLEQNGIQLKTDGILANTLPWGVMVTEGANGLVVNKVNRNSVASEAGISAKDVIVAIDGLKANKKQLEKVTKQQIEHDEDVVCYAFRRDELLEFNVASKTQAGQSARPTLGKAVLFIHDTEQANTWLDVNP
ncbi:PDZ domain-containing protein [Psychrobacter sp. HD31]|uniref:M61 family metallopeptidase n=1 Tax=Psychrobacter sp. HD31 TaxID=3112003 RepID=UPI003DA2A05D